MARGWTWKRGTAVGLVGLVVALAGCAAPGSGPGDGVAIQSAVAGFSVEQRPIEYEVFGDGPVTILVVGGLHGDEPASPVLVDQLVLGLTAAPRHVRDRTVVVVPRANPDGVARGRRTNARGVDLNRDLPARNRRLTQSPQPETEALAKLIRTMRPVRILAVHQPLTCIDYDGPAEDVARAMAKRSDLPVRALGPQTGSLGSWLGEDMGLQVVTVELPESASRLEPAALWDRYGPMLLAGIREPL